MSTEESLRNNPFALPAWAHASGTLALRDTAPGASPASVAARMLITERLARYAWAYDERRGDALAACFANDAVWEGNVLGQIAIGPFTGREHICRWLTGFWPHQRDQRRHMIMNTIVEEQSEDTALTLSYLLLTASNAQRVSVESSGFYRVEYCRVDDDWLIRRFTGGFDAPFWPGELKNLSPAGRVRHGIAPE